MESQNKLAVRIARVRQALLAAVTLTSCSLWAAEVRADLPSYAVQASATRLVCRSLANASVEIKANKVAASSVQDGTKVLRLVIEATQVNVGLGYVNDARPTSQAPSTIPIEFYKIALRPSSQC